MAALLKTVKSPYLSNGLTNGHEIFHDDTHCLYMCTITAVVISNLLLITATAVYQINSNNKN